MEKNEESFFLGPLCMFQKRFYQGKSNSFMISIQRKKYIESFISDDTYVQLLCYGGILCIKY